MPGSEDNSKDNKDKPVGRARVVKKKAARVQARKTKSLGELASKKNSARVVHPSLFLFTLYFIYKNLYILGITLLRRRLRYARRMRLQFSKFKGSLYGLRHRMGLFIRRMFRGLLRRIRAPFDRISDTYHTQQSAIETAKREQEHLIRAYMPVVEAVARLVWKILYTLFNYTAPVVAAMYLLITVNQQMTQPIGLLLEYDNQEMGYIRNEGSFDDAVLMVRERITAANAQQFATEIPSFKLVLMDSEVNEFISSDELADKIIRASGQEIEEAYGLYINNSFLGAVIDKDAILGEFSAIKRRNATGKRNERVEFIKNIEFPPGLYPRSSVVNTESVLAILRANEDERETYIVESGDTPSEIADKIGMSYSQLLALNPTIEEDLKPGMELTTQVARPYLSVKTTYTDEYEEEIPFPTVETENALYAKSYRKVEQEGVDGLQVVTADITTINGIETSREVKDTQVLRDPVEEKVTVGIENFQVAGGSTGSGSGSNTDRTPSQRVSSSFIWPTVSGRATTYGGHTGIDIAPGGAGHPIYASASGTVVQVQAGWVGYGHQIVIDHGNGYKTRYAHCSELYVRVGDQVSQGQVIAAMGKTGRATGNHLHFEVILNGRWQNAADYVGWSG